MTRRWDWLHQAACAGDPNPTWITNPTHTNPTDIATAIATCHTCPVITTCAAHHARQPHFEGIAAGTLHHATIRQHTRTTPA